MKKAVFITVCLCLAVPLALAQNASKLKSIKKIYIGELGKKPEAELIREKIRLRLAQSGRFSVVEKTEEPDAMLTGVVSVETVNTLVVGGAAGVSWGQPPYDPIYGPVYRPGYGGRTIDVGTYGGKEPAQAGTAVLKLIDSKSQETIWVYEIKPEGAGREGATSQVADKAVKQLLKEAKKADGA